MFEGRPAGARELATASGLAVSASTPSARASAAAIACSDSGRARGFRAASWARV
jgi:hypothetical protein